MQTAGAGLRGWRTACLLWSATHDQLSALQPGMARCHIQTPPCQAAALLCGCCHLSRIVCRRFDWISPLQGSLLLPTTHHVHAAQAEAYSEMPLAGTQQPSCLSCSAPVL